MIRLPTISLCMIAKNEEARLPTSLRHARAFDRAVVIDTGSTDNTKDLARQLGAEVYDFTWCDDFSKARNEWHKYVTKGWIFWLDGDDEIAEAESLRYLTHLAPDDRLGYMFTYRYPNNYQVKHIRLYRADKGISWRGRIHEHLDFTGKKGEVVLADDYVTFEIFHHFPSYSHKAHLERSERNNRLLEKMIEEEPDRALWWNYLASDAEWRGEYEKAEEYYAKVFRLANPFLDYFWLSESYITFAMMYAKQGRRGKATKILKRGHRELGAHFENALETWLKIKRPDGQSIEEFGISRLAERSGHKKQPHSVLPDGS